MKMFQHNQWNTKPRVPVESPVPVDIRMVQGQLPQVFQHLSQVLPALSAAETDLMVERCSHGSSSFWHLTLTTELLTWVIANEI